MHYFRIAPTPSGYLHLGNAFNFILTALLAGAGNASLRLRIDDGDATRVRPEYLTDIFETMRWLGICWDEGPRDEAGHTAHYSQALRAARYDEMLRRLVATGQVFACDCSRKDIVTASADGQYPGTCCNKALPLDTPDTALRLRTPQDAVVHFTDVLLGPQALRPYMLARDPVVRRRDGLAAYHLVSLTDDLDFGTTHIVRGEDLLGSTAVQLFISQVIGDTAFDTAGFFHHSLLAGDDGEKLSKSAGSRSLKALRNEGRASSAVYRQFAFWMQWPRPAADFLDAAGLFAQHGFGALKRPAPLRRSAE